MFKATIKAFFISNLLFVLPLFSESAGKDMPFSDKALEIYKTAVELRTAKGHNQVPKLAKYLESEFMNGGFSKNDINILEMGETAALVVRYKGDDSLGKKPISISAHMDVVDAMRDDWTRDPFTLVEEKQLEL